MASSRTFIPFPAHTATMIPPVGSLTDAEFVQRCHEVRTGGHHYRGPGNRWVYATSRKRTGTLAPDAYPNYYPVWDSAYRNLDTDEVVWLYVPSAENVTETIRQEAAATIATISGRSLAVIRHWLGLDPPDPQKYLEAFLDAPRPETLRDYNAAVARAREVRDRGGAER